MYNIMLPNIGDLPLVNLATVEAPNLKEPKAAAAESPMEVESEPSDSLMEVEGEPSGPPPNVTVSAESHMEKFNALARVADILFKVGSPGPAVNSYPTATRESARIAARKEKEMKDRLASVTDPDRSAARKEKNRIKRGREERSAEQKEKIRLAPVKRRRNV